MDGSSSGRYECWNLQTLILNLISHYMKPCVEMHSCIFSIITAVFSVTWSSEIIIIYWFASQETFLIIINVEKIPPWFDEYEVQKNSISLKQKSNIIHDPTLTFDQFNASVLHSFKEKPQTVEQRCSWSVQMQSAGLQTH